jgi:hypothetical protein
MKLTTASLALLLAAGLASCNSAQTTTEATTTDTAAVATGPMATTTTTTTTVATPVAFTPQPEVQYMNLKTKKMVMVRVDTVHHYIVDKTTNEPIDFLVIPGTTDTVYGRNMRIANHAIRYTNNNWSYDESLLNTPPADNSSMSNTDGTNTTGTSTTTNTTNNTTNNNSNIPDDARKVKIKENENGTKTKIKR